MQGFSFDMHRQYLAYERADDVFARVPQEEVPQVAGPPGKPELQVQQSELLQRGI